MLRADDDLMAIEGGACGIMINNHGGRQLDSAVSPIQVLEEIAGKVGGRVPIVIDSGVRNAEDIGKLLPWVRIQLCLADLY